MNTLRADDEAGVVGSKPITAEIFHESVENPGTHLNQLKTQAHRLKTLLSIEQHGGHHVGRLAPA